MMLLKSHLQGEELRALPAINVLSRSKHKNFLFTRINDGVRTIVNKDYDLLHLSTVVKETKESKGL